MSIERWFSDVDIFHAIMNFPPYFDAQDFPDVTPATVTAKRKSLIAGEHTELQDALDEGDRLHILHEGIDLMYVTLGSLLEAGFTPPQIDAAWSLVHEANMNKTTPKHPMGKAVKGEGWEPADMSVAALAEAPLTRWVVSTVDGNGSLSARVTEVEGEWTNSKLFELGSRNGGAVLSVSPVSIVTPDVENFSDDDHEPEEIEVTYELISEFMETHGIEDYQLAKGALDDWEGNAESAMNSIRNQGWSGA